MMKKGKELAGLNLVKSGKVRNIYEMPEHPDKLLFVTTDRISAYDVVMNEIIEGKGILLNKISNFWFDFFSDIPNHLITTNISEYPSICHQYTEHLVERSMLVKRLKILPIECIVRGRLTGSYLKAYKKSRAISTESPGIWRGKNVCGFVLPMNLEENAILDPPLFTPSTKAEQGAHDENISFEQMANIIGEDLARQIETTSIELYTRASTYALERGIVIADTKFEFGLDIDGILTLADEVLTPDSSRFWPTEKVVIGKTPPSFDKQYLRDWLINTCWDRMSPPPTVPDKIKIATYEKYKEVLELLTKQ